MESEAPKVVLTTERKIVYGFILVCCYMLFLWLPTKFGLLRKDPVVPRIVRFYLPHTTFHRDVLSNAGGVYRFKDPLIKKWGVSEWWIDGPTKHQMVTTLMKGLPCTTFYDNEGHLIPRRKS